MTVLDPLSWSKSALECTPGSKRPLFGPNGHFGVQKTIFGSKRPLLGAKRPILVNGLLDLKNDRFGPTVVVQK